MVMTAMGFVCPDPPAKDTRGTYKEDGKEVEEDGLDGARGLGVPHGWRIIGFDRVMQRSHGGQVGAVDGQMSLEL